MDGSECWSWAKSWFWLIAGLQFQEPPSCLDVTGLHAVQSFLTPTIRAALSTCTETFSLDKHHTSVISDFFSLVPEEQRQRRLAGKRSQTKSLWTSDCVERAGFLSLRAWKVSACNFIMAKCFFFKVSQPLTKQSSHFLDCTLESLGAIVVQLCSAPSQTKWVDC